MKWGPSKVLSTKVIGSELNPKVPQRLLCRGQPIAGRVDPGRPVRGHCSILSREEDWTKGTFSGGDEKRSPSGLPSKVQLLGYSDCLNMGCEQKEYVPSK